MSATGRRIALIGCGRMGRVRAEALRALGESVALAYDPDDDAVRSSAPEARALRDPRELEGEALDALFVCTPPGARGEAELACVRRGVPTFLEKPLAVDEEGARAWMDARGSTSTLVAVGYMNRYRTSVLAARDKVRDEGLVAASGTWTCGPYARDWWRDPELSGGPLNEQMTHLVDLLRFVGGEVELVSTIGRADDSEPATASEAAIALRFEGGAVGTLAYSCEAKEKGIGLRLVTRQRPFALEGWDFQDPTAPAADEDVFLAETRGFLALASGQARPDGLVDLDDAARTHRVVAAIRRSLAQGGTPVRVGDAR